MLSNSHDLSYNKHGFGYLFNSFSSVDIISHCTQESLANDMINTDIFNAVASVNDNKYELNGLIQHFESYFRQKLDSELLSFHTNMHRMLSEQRTHIKEILFTSSTCPINEIETNICGSTEKESNANEEDSTSNWCTDQKFTSEAKASLMIELLSLSCQLSALLNLPQFT